MEFSIAAETGITEVLPLSSLWIFRFAFIYVLFT
jgi:hypothetical protein